MHIHAYIGIIYIKRYMPAYIDTYIHTYKYVYRLTYSMSLPGLEVHSFCKDLSK
jgi:hypothetical protein